MINSITKSLHIIEEEDVFETILEEIEEIEEILSAAKPGIPQIPTPSEHVALRKNKATQILRPSFDLCQARNTEPLPILTNNLAYGNNIRDAHTTIEEELHDNMWITNFYY